MHAATFLDFLLANSHVSLFFQFPECFSLFLGNMKSDQFMQHDLLYSLIKETALVTEN